VEPGRLLAGEYPGQYTSDSTRRRIDALLESGFDTFIDLTRPNETVPYHRLLLEEAKLYEVRVERHSFPIGDFGLPTPAGMRSILDAIDAALENGRKIYLHCWGGIGRTGTTVGCYLVRRGMTGDEALRQLAKWWQGVPKSRIHQRSPETYEQAQFVREWAAHDRDRGDGDK
jgi:protein-tyrosine phosphatase